MKSDQFENPWQKKVRNLSQVLIFSVGINVALALALLITLHEKSVVKKEIVYTDTDASFQKNAEIVEQLFSCSFTDLLELLDDQTTMQDGFLKRDLALAVLISFHDFDIDKALSGFQLQKRQITFVHRSGGEKFSMSVIAGLGDHHYQLIRAFNREHPWPMTSAGLFRLLKEKRERAPSSLVTTFFATPEFYAIYTMLNRFESGIVMEKVLLMLLDGNFEMVRENYRRLQSGQASLSFLRGFFQQYVEVGSSYACALWVSCDGKHIVRNLNDETLLRIVKQLRDHNQNSLHFLKQVLCSLRMDTIRGASAEKLYQFSGLPRPEPYCHESALKQFLPQVMVTASEPATTISNTTRSADLSRHVVSHGDSLWKIARRYHTSIESLRRTNHLTSDTLKPGQELLIPSE